LIEAIKSNEEYIKKFYRFLKNVYFEMLKHQEHTNVFFFETGPCYVAQQSTTDLMHPSHVNSFLLSFHHSKLFFIQNSVLKEQNGVN
jgi:hypothetical protein